MQRQRVASTVIVAVVALSAYAVGALVDTRPGVPFGTIVNCAPLGIYVTPSPDASYSIQVDADAAVKEKITTTVTNKILSIGLSGGFSSANPIKVVVNMPATALTGVVSGGTASVQVASGFVSDSLTLSQSGAGGMVVQNVTVQQLNIQSTGLGNLVVEGSIGASTVTAVGTGDVGISGSRSTVTYSSKGLGSLVVKGSPTTAITSASSGASLAKIFYDQGTCNSQASFPFSSPCTQTSSVTMPAVGTQWTCGITVSGGFSATGGACTGSGAATSIACSAPS